MKRLAAVVAVMCLLASALPLLAQSPKPYHDGSVWQIATIHVKAGMEDRYMRYLATDWKKEQEAMKKAGYILSYKVITTENHNPNEANVVLMTEFKNLATMEANQEKAEALAEQIFGGQSKIEGGYTDRSSYRDVLGGRLGREVILEPKQ